MFPITFIFFGAFFGGLAIGSVMYCVGCCWDVCCITFAGLGGQGMDNPSWRSFNCRGWIQVIYLLFSFSFLCFFFFFSFFFFFFFFFYFFIFYYFFIFFFNFGFQPEPVPGRDPYTDDLWTEWSPFADCFDYDFPHVSSSLEPTATLKV